MIEPLDLATRAIHAIDCEPDCREELTTCGRYGRYARAALDAVRHIELLADVERLTGELAEAQRERDLAIAHDRQPYPTADAYERACAALHRAKAERNRYRAVVDAAKAWRNHPIGRLVPAVDRYEQDLIAAVDALNATQTPSATEHASELRTAAHGHAGPVSGAP